MYVVKEIDSESPRMARVVATQSRGGQRLVRRLTIAANAGTFRRVFKVIRLVCADRGACPSRSCHEGPQLRARNDAVTSCSNASRSA